MKIIMNAPYNKNLHLKILQEAMKHSDDVVCLHPKDYYTQAYVYFNNAPWTRECYKALVEYEDIDMDVAREAFGQGFNTLHLIIGKYDINHNGPDAYDIKLDELRKKIRYGKSGDTGAPGKYRVPREKLGKKPYALVNQYFGENAEPSSLFADESSKVGFGIEFDTEEELKNWKTWFISSKIITWLWKKMKSLYGLVPKVDWKHPWTDEMLYEYFDLTEDEINEIEKEIDVLLK